MHVALNSRLVFYLLLQMENSVDFFGFQTLKNYLGLKNIRLCASWSTESRQFCCKNARVNKPQESQNGGKNSLQSSLRQKQQRLKHESSGRVETRSSTAAASAGAVLIWIVIFLVPLVWRRGWRYKQGRRRGRSGRTLLLPDELDVVPLDVDLKSIFRRCRT